MLVHTIINTLLAAMKNGKSKYCNCLYFAAGAFARNMTRLAVEEFAVTGLSPSYAFLLMTINDQPGMQPNEVASIMHLTPSTVSRLVEKMESKKFVRRVFEGKRTEIYPMKKSLQLDERIRKAWQQLYHRYTTLLGEKKSNAVTSDIYDFALLLDGKKKC